MKKLLVAAIVVLMASPAFAAIQNVKVSGDITSTFLDRNNFTLGDTALNSSETLGSVTSAPGVKKQNVFITQTRVRIDADLSDNVSTTVGLINERAWNAEGSNDTNVQLYLASVTMRELLYSPLSVTIGRQMFVYGNGLILGNGPNNVASGNLGGIAADLTMRSSNDGIKAVLDYKPLTIDMFYFKNSESSKAIAGNFVSNPQQSSDVFGINANYQLSDSWNTVLEGYLFSEINGSGSFATTGGDNINHSLTGIEGKGSKLYVPGLRASTNPVKGLNVQGELAWQLGNQVIPNPTGTTYTGVESERRGAMAAQMMASYALPVLQKYKPAVNASYTYVSGDKNAYANANDNPEKSAKVFRAWDPMFEGQGQGTIYNTLFPLSDMNIVSVGASANPMEDVTTAFTWSNLWAAAKYTSNNPLFIMQPNGAYSLSDIQNAPISSKKDPRGLGNEYDVNVTYNYTEDVSFGVSLGWFIPGQAFAGVTTGSLNEARGTASQAIADVAVKF